MLLVKTTGINHYSKNLSNLWPYHRFSSIQRKSNSFFFTLPCGCRKAKVLPFFTRMLTKILTSTSAYKNAQIFFIPFCRFLFVTLVSLFWAKLLKNCLQFQPSLPFSTIPTIWVLPPSRCWHCPCQRHSSAYSESTLCWASQPHWTASVPPSRKRSLRL